MKTRTSQLVPNGYRDLVLNPIDPSKVAGLVESYKDTDFWENLIARPLGNEYNGMTGDDLVEFLKSLDEAPADMKVEIGYGHNRVAALQEAGIEEINIPIKVIEDEVMLKIMANENKGDWGSNMNVILETVRQVRVTIHGTVVAYETFEDYAVENSFFKTQKTFSAAKDITNIGYRRLTEFLGETWSESDVRFADATLKAVDDGTIEQSQVVHMPSIGVMRQYILLAKAIRDNEWPSYFKDLYVQESSDYICNEGTTVKIATRGATMVKKGNLPMEYLTKQKVVPFDITKELKKVCEGKYDHSEKPVTMEPDELLNVEGIGDYEGIQEIVNGLKEANIKAAERREAAGGAPDEEPEGAEQSAAESDVSTEAQAAIDKAEADAGAVAEPSFPTNIEVPAEGSDARERIDMVMQTAAGVKFQVEQLRGQTQALLDTDEGLATQFGTSFDTLFTAVAQLGLEVYGRVYLNEALDTAEETI